MQSNKWLFLKPILHSACSHISTRCIYIHLLYPYTPVKNEAVLHHWLELWPQKKILWLYIFYTFWIILAFCLNFNLISWEPRRHVKESFALCVKAALFLYDYIICENQLENKNSFWVFSFSFPSKQYWNHWLQCDYLFLGLRNMLLSLVVPAHW